MKSVLSTSSRRVTPVTFAVEPDYRSRAPGPAGGDDESSPLVRTTTDSARRVTTTTTTATADDDGSEYGGSVAGASDMSLEAAMRGNSYEPGSRTGVIFNTPQALAEINRLRFGVYDPRDGSLIITDSEIAGSDLPMNEVLLERLSLHGQDAVAACDNGDDDSDSGSVELTMVVEDGGGPSSSGPRRAAGHRPIDRSPPSKKGGLYGATARAHLARHHHPAASHSASQQHMPRWARKQHMATQNSGETTLFGKLLGRHEDEIQDNMLAFSLSDDEPKPRMALDPRSAARCRWDMVIILCVMWTCFILPLRVGFGDSDIGPVTMLDFFIDFIFVIDMAVNFYTGYFVFDESKELRVERRIKPSALHYAKTWFAFDFVATIPVEFIFLAMTESEAYDQTAVYVRTTRALRLCRIHRMFRYLKTWQELIRIPPHYLRVGKLVFLIVVFAHFDACVIFWASQLEGFPENSWVAKQDLIHASKGEQYSYSLFMSLSHMLCIGYGPDGGPGTMVELWITTISMLTGASFFVILVGMITSSLMAEDALDRVATTDMELEDELLDMTKDVVQASADGNSTTQEEKEMLRPAVDVIAEILSRTKKKMQSVASTDRVGVTPRLKLIVKRRATQIQAQQHQEEMQRLATSAANSSNHTEISVHGGIALSSN